MELEKLEGYQRFVTNDLVAELEKYFPEGSSTLCGIVGGRRPSSYSLSPSLWNTAYRILKIDAVYIAFDVSVEPDHNNLIAFIDRLVGDDRFRVLSITDPYKQTVLQHLNTRGEVDGVARQIGAVNTIIRTEAGLCGYNTDGVGMARNLSSVIDLKEGRVLQLGAGGAGRAIAHGLTERMGNGVYYLLNRTVSRAKELAASLERADHRLEIRPLGGAADRDWLEAEEIEGLIARYAPQVDLLLNTTTLPRPISPETARLIPEAVVFADARYAPELVGPFQEVAEQTGHRFIDGLGMLFWQFVEAFQHAHGIDLNEDRAVLNTCASAIGYRVGLDE